MQQFDICRLRPTGDRRRAVALVVILQADLMSDLETRVVAPVAPINDFKPISKMRPEFEVAGKRYHMIADRMSVLTRKEIGSVVASVQDRQWDIRRALDLVFVGV